MHKVDNLRELLLKYWTAQEVIQESGGGVTSFRLSEGELVSRNVSKVNQYKT